MELKNLKVGDIAYCCLIPNDTHPVKVEVKQIEEGIITCGMREGEYEKMKETTTMLRRLGLTSMNLDHIPEPVWKFSILTGMCIEGPFRENGLAKLRIDKPKTNHNPWDL